MGDVVPFTPPALRPRDPRFVPRPVEMCQLAGVWAGTLPPGQWEAELKVDGVRAIWADGELWSREGVPLELPHVAADLARLEARFGEPMAIDGEYQEPGGFLDTLAVIQSRGRREARGVLHVFDALPLSAWRADDGEEPVETRRHWLGRAWADWSPAHLRRVPVVPVFSAQAIEARARTIWSAGGEGLVLKRTGAPYRRARSTDWLKVKREITLTGEVVELVDRAARVRIKGRLVGVALAPGQADPLAVGMCVTVQAMEWTERGQLRHARVVAIGKD